MKKGFTLIELLAVIVILAIIATIATPIVLSIIEDAKESTTLRNAEYYLDAVEQSIAKQSLNTGSAYQPTECEIQEDGNLLCDGEVEVIVEVKGKKPSKGTITFEEGKMINISLEIENKEVIQNENNELVIGGSSTENNSICKLYEGEPKAIGSKYQCKVKDDMEEGFEDGYYFFVLSNEDDGTTNLIMERNIYYDQTNDVGMVATETNTGLLKWYATSLTNEFGPVTTMDYLYNATKDWNNVPNIIMNYTDEGNTGNYGYGTITTTDNITKITKKDGSAVTVLTDKEGYTNLKARMPYRSEVSDYDRVNNPNVYLYDYLEAVYSTNRISGIDGYFILSSYSTQADWAPYVYAYGFVSGGRIDYAEAGVRPVINLKLSATEKPTNPKPPTVDEPTEPPVLSNFTFDGVSYQFEEGMTWFDWLFSDYNTGDFAAGGHYVEEVNRSGGCTFWGPNGMVEIGDVIIAGASYGI